ncbi:MAG: ABC transporter substrate-binding protein, partial [Coprobacillus sp.]
MKKRKSLILMIALGLVVGLSGCSGKTAAYPGTPDKDMVTLNVVSEPTDLNSLGMIDLISQSVLAHCMSGFTRLDENDSPVADLAESWDINDSKTEYVMHLRKDAKWSNGDQVTVRDFYFAWVKHMTASTGSVYASYLYSNIKNGEDFYNGKVDESKLGLTIVDDYTLKIEWSHPMNNALFYFSQPYYLPINQKAYESIGASNYAKEANQIVTNGAYTLSEWVHDDHITLEKSKDYYDASNIKINKIKLAMITDSNTSINAFKAGEIDMSNLYAEQIQQIKDADKDAV